MRLKGEDKPRISEAFAEFQFHIGAIKSEVKNILISLLLWFQFHIGAIKSIIYFTIKYIYESFNSILVRLKEGCPYYEDKSNIRFNSILVRLKG